MRLLSIILLTVALNVQAQFGTFWDLGHVDFHTAAPPSGFYTNGHTTIGSSSSATSRQLSSTPITNEFGKSVRLVKLIFYGSATGGGPIVGAVHDSTASKTALTVLSTNTSPGTLTVSAGWTEIPMNYVVTNGQIYGLSAWGSNTMNYFSFTLGAGSERNTQVGANTGWPNWGTTFVYNTLSSNRYPSIYGVYQDP
jgi:hypothetical protein